ncbi:hypothetical protein MTP02_58010 [Streptomyces albus]|nr:hypothetical protein MTP02_58010 [Streptomyces albus]
MLAQDGGGGTEGADPVGGFLGALQEEGDPVQRVFGVHGGSLRYGSVPERLAGGRAAHPAPAREGGGMFNQPPLLSGVGALPGNGAGSGVRPAVVRQEGRA